MFFVLFRPCGLMGSRSFWLCRKVRMGFSVLLFPKVHVCRHLVRILTWPPIGTNLYLHFEVKEKLCLNHTVIFIFWFLLECLNICKRFWALWAVLMVSRKSDAQSSYFSCSPEGMDSWEHYIMNLSLMREKSFSIVQCYYYNIKYYLQETNI